MAVIETGAIFKSLTFDGIDSRDYGVYITGEAVFNAPERDVEMVTIPGRNGTLVRDKGRFNNITVTYPAGMFQRTDADFADAISDFRNALCAATGYCRLEDEYHPDEYREAVYKSGLDVSPANLKAGEFNITFECKPQRFLKTGETKQTVTSGSAITNPTRFSSRPIIEATGYGTLKLGDKSINITNDPLGAVRVAEAQTLAPDVGQTAATLTIDSALLTSGDPIRLRASLPYAPTAVGSTVSLVSISGKTGGGSAYVDGAAGVFSIDETFTRGTSKTVSATFDMIAELANGTTRTFSISVSVAYNGNQTFTFTRTEFAAYGVWGFLRPSWSVNEVTANSSTVASAPVTINCETGEAYQTIGGVVTNANSKVYLGATLPELKPGANTLTFPNTLTVSIYPRWWIV